MSRLREAVCSGLHKLLKRAKRDRCVGEMTDVVREKVDRTPLSVGSEYERITGQGKSDGRPGSDCGARDAVMIDE